MRVDIVAMTPNPIDMLYLAARTCKSDEPPQDLLKKHKLIPVEEKVRLLAKLWQKEHLSIFEHVAVTYAIAGISRSCLAQLTRHRIGVSPSVSSQRRRLDIDFVLPPSVEKDKDLLVRWERFLDVCTAFYRAMLEGGVAPEDARFVLPNAAATNLVLTVNLRSLGDLYKKRALNPAAQWEIRQLVSAMVEKFLEEVPELSVLFGK